MREHSVHGEGEGDEDDAVDGEEVDEVVEEHLLQHDREAARDPAGAREEQHVHPAVQQRQRQRDVLVGGAPRVQQEPLECEARETDVDDPIRSVARDCPLGTEARDGAEQEVAALHQLDAVGPRAVEVEQFEDEVDDGERQEARHRQVDGWRLTQHDLGTHHANTPV